MLSNDPKVKDRLRAWLLAHLKENPLQKAIYRNILIHHGLESPIDESWEERATQYWNLDNASDYETEYEDGDDPLTRATSHDLGVDESSTPFTQFDGQQPHFLGTSQQAIIKTQAGSNMAQPKPMSLLSSAISSRSPLTLKATDTRSTGTQEHLTALSSGAGETAANAINGQLVPARIKVGQQLMQEMSTSVEPSNDMPHDDCRGLNSLNYSTTAENNSLIEIVRTMDLQIGGSPFGKKPAPNLSYRPNIPTIVTTDADAHAAGRMIESIQKHKNPPPHVQPVQTPESLSCESPWSRVVIVGVNQSPRPNSDYGGEKGRRERLMDMFSNLRHHRRTHSASHIFGSRDANHNLGRKSRD
jgi:hypothetical protein